MKRIFCLILLLSINIISYSQVQVNDVNDARAFLQEYLSPLGNGLGAITNNGWYNTAKPHRFLGFDANFTLSLLNINDENKNFDPNSIPNFSSQSNSTPTILGRGDGAVVNYKGNEFKLPDQTTLISALALPNFNFGLGIFKKTELNGRFIPNYKYNIGFFGKGEISMWGVGFKHDILQWIPIIGNAIPMSLSIQAGYSALETELRFANHDVSLKTQATTINLVASKKILILTGYAGVGFNSTKTNFNASTNFNIDNISFSESLDIDFKSNNDFRANIGLRVNLAVITMHADYTFSKYPTATLGLGVSLR